MNRQGRKDGGDELDDEIPEEIREIIDDLTREDHAGYGDEQLMAVADALNAIGDHRDHELVLGKLGEAGFHDVKWDPERNEYWFDC